MPSKHPMAKLAAATLLGGIAALGSAHAQTNAAAPLCPLTQQTFRTWQAQSQFTGTLNFVPPDSTAFKPTSLCSFYQWAAQMALWLMSTDKSGNLTMFSPTFYNAVASFATGTETFALVRNTETVTSNAAGLRKPNIPFSVRVNKPFGMTARARAAIAARSPQGPGGIGQADDSVLVVNGTPVFVSGSSGPATYPLVYYAIHVNDVFVVLQQNQTVNYYTTGSNAGNFPITAEQVTQIAQAASATFPDANQMAMELKTSWVDTTYLTGDQASGLIRITADVPTFTQSTVAGNLVLTPTGQTAERTLALVGLHIAATVAGHPEMIWATFETPFNSPDATYSYLNSNFNTQSQTCPTTTPPTDCITTLPFSSNSTGRFVFYNAPGAQQPPSSITATARFNADSSGTYVSFTSPSITSTNVARLNPWGNQQPASPTLSDPVVKNNTNLISLNQSLAPLLRAEPGNGNVLANYVHIGAIWTHGQSPFDPNSNPVGSTLLANTTMETFVQSMNCFLCHSKISTQGTGISHVFPYVTSVTSSASR